MIVAYNSYTKQNKDITITRKMFLDTGEYDYGMKEDDGRLTVCLNADKVMDSLAVSVFLDLLKKRTNLKPISCIRYFER